MERNRLFFLKLCCLIVTTTAILLHHHVLVAVADDATVMANLAKSLTPTPAGWTGGDACSWPGVNCNGMGNVRSINLSSMAVAGRLPPDLNRLSSLKFLILQKNRLSGQIPSFSSHTSLEHLMLDDNKFTSVSPNFLAGLASIRTISLNEIPTLSPWKFPAEITESPFLVSFSCSRCSLYGEIPDIFGSISGLQILRLSYNNLTGTLPPSLEKSGIQELALNNQLQGLTGGIEVIGKMEHLSHVRLHVNRFTGPIPDLSRCHFLSEVTLRDNLLTGVIPDSFTSLHKLSLVSLQNNKFQGPPPTFLQGVQVTLGTTNNFCVPSTVAGNCSLLVNILLEVAKDLGYPMVLADSWTGNDPCKNDWTFIACDANGDVTVINLSNHNWAGSISPAIGNLTGLKELILHDNKLTGEIPDSLADLPALHLVDVANNNISGEIPSFSDDVIVKVDGNPWIGTELPPPGAPPDSGMKRNTELTPTVIAAITLVAVINFIALFWIIYRRCKKMRSRKYKWLKGKGSGGKEKSEGPPVNVSPYGAITSESASGHGSSEIPLYESGHVLIPFEILRESTNHFSDGNILGRGGFGIVYKGTLYDGTRIAVKRMEASLLTSKGTLEFKAEIEVLTKVRHRHLVALHGYCVNGNERLLVFEYMPQGTLGQHLFRRDGFPPLTWKQRVTIALDVARGIEYLHSLAQQSFIHRDLKPSNILLDDGKRAKVSDFGLVKNAPDGGTSLETKLAGTFGYLAPEYAATGRVTTKVDVYSFGVVLMELMTGRKALDDSLPEESIHLVPWFRRLLANREKLRSILDPCLNPDDETFESICRVADLAGYCTAREPQQRPDMNHAVNFLSPLVEQWIPVNTGEEDDGYENDDDDFQMSLPQALQRWKANEDSTMVSEDYSYMYGDDSCTMERLPPRV
ncbi:PREDICTED: receptor-like kinase TMK4 [Ipomoea nil]|uniref:receptor-like kinase TMK4 n=1 Tax=Ipomoea nil TaxID=35883 RepID=UPI000900C915|nr:PREDICTED: receptor-like kinase TMK4 [Ipomoea nil]